MNITEPIMTNTQYPFLEYARSELHQKFSSCSFETQEIPDRMEMGLYASEPCSMEEFHKARIYCVTHLMTRAFNRMGRPGGLITIPPADFWKLRERAISFHTKGEDSIFLQLTVSTITRYEIWWIKHRAAVSGQGCLYELFEEREKDFAKEFFEDMVKKMEAWHG